MTSLRPAALTLIIHCTHLGLVARVCVQTIYLDGRVHTLVSGVQPLVRPGLTVPDIVSGDGRAGASRLGPRHPKAALFPWEAGFLP